jgi:hypothetical protein
MSPIEFKRQIDRLTATYGPKAYPQERADILWNEFKSLGSSTFERVVTKLIAENSTAPMIQKFREALATARESAWGSQKKQYASEARNFSGIQGMADQSVDFKQYIRGAVHRNEKEEMYWLMKVFGMDKIEQILGEIA